MHEFSGHVETLTVYRLSVEKLEYLSRFRLFFLRAMEPCRGHPEGNDEGNWFAAESWQCVGGRSLAGLEKLFLLIH